MQSTMDNRIIIGNHGDGIRSDVKITFVLKKSGGREITIRSKVQSMYGNDILRLADKMLDFYGVGDAALSIDDSGALPFVLMARIEAAIRKITGSTKEFLPEHLPENQTVTQKVRQRISRLYLPGNTPSLMINAGIHKPHGLILDLEDAVAPSKKYEARFLVRNALRQLRFYGAERMVRINQMPEGAIDLGFVVPHGVNVILLPKCESPDQVKMVNQHIDEIQQHQKKQQVWIMPIIESALGVINAYNIATAAENIIAIAIGLEDYTADLGTRRTDSAEESFFARSTIVNAARAADVRPIDSVFSDVSDMEGLKENVKRSKALGFDGMGCIHPRQIRVIHENFAPGTEEFERAMKIVKAFDDATAKGLGVVALGTKMIDPPVVKRAQQCVDMAVNMGIIEKNWKEKYEEIR
ncbi:MAG: aldolase/citrate lyase family protein [Bacteroidales bacterium]|nr:aldolase/citrate lyase family protein [Bacteroidales bacterium]